MSGSMPPCLRTTAPLHAQGLTQMHASHRCAAKIAVCAVPLACLSSVTCEVRMTIQGRDQSLTH